MKLGYGGYFVGPAAFTNTQGGFGPQVGIGIGVSNWLFANVEPADRITPNRTKRKMFFTVSPLSFLRK